MKRILILSLIHLGKKIQRKGTLTRKSLELFGWTRIPNCEHVKITNFEINPHLRKFGIHVRNGRKLEVTPLLNDKANKYMSFQLRRLEHAKNSVHYWSIVNQLFIRSSVFKVSALQKVMKRWERQIPLDSIFNILEKVRRIFLCVNNGRRTVGTFIAGKEIILCYKRVYIPKYENADLDKGDLRPLGVPTPEWRIVLHMYNNLLYRRICKPLWQENKLTLFMSSMHGFIKNRGTLTAWRELIKYLNCDYVFKSDLKQFFPSSKISNFFEELRYTLGFSKVKYAIDIWNRCAPIFPPELKLPEEAGAKEKYRLIEEFIKMRGKGGAWNISIPKGYGDLTGYDLGHKYTEFHLARLWKGFPQGSPLSPLASIIPRPFREFLAQKPSVSYADDPVFFDNKPFHIIDNPREGIVLHPDKSKWIKIKGKWLSEIKYLGLVYDPFKNELRSETREGKTLSISVELRNAIILSGHPCFKNNQNLNWNTLVQSKIFGLIMARMYSGSWSPKLDTIPDTQVHPRSLLGLIPQWCPLWYRINLKNGSTYGSWLLLEMLRIRKVGV